MIVRSARVAALATLAVAGFVAAGATGAAAACKGHPHYGTGSPNAVQFFASTSAKYAWKSAVAGHDGPKWDTWSVAANKSVNCKKSGPGGTWVCTAKARPCH